MQLEQRPDTIGLNGMLQTLISLQDYEAAARYEQKLARFRDNRTDCYSLEIAVRRKKMSRARRFAEKISSKTEETCEYYQSYVLGLYYSVIHDYEKALPFLEMAYNEMSSNVELVKHFVIAYIPVGDRKQVDKFSPY